MVGKELIAILELFICRWNLIITTTFLLFYPNLSLLTPPPSPTHTLTHTQTLHSVCRIADVLLALQQKGNVKYTRWVLNFHCAVDMVDTLQQQAKDMEEELQVWEDQVRQTREQYYELNYYTTLQLLTLRKELGRLKTSGQPRAHTQINPHVLALLESISTEITSPDVWEVVKSVTAEQQGGRGGGTRPFPNQYHPSAEKMTANIAGPTAQVVENVRSSQSSITKEILASADLQASASTSAASLLQPKLTQDDLTERQKEIFDNLMSCDYPEQVVLVALEKFGEDQYEAEDWILANASRCYVLEVEGAEIGAETDEEMESESDSDSESDLYMVSAATPCQSLIGMGMHGSILWLYDDHIASHPDSFYFPLSMHQRCKSRVLRDSNH